MAVEFRVLGPVRASIGERPVDLGHARQRCVLAVLLVEANQWLSADQLLDRAWGDRVPPGGRSTLYGYLSRLRRALRATRQADIVHRANGYEIVVDEDAVDVHRFRRLVALARAETDQVRALELAERASGLWRGEALLGLDTPWTTAVRNGLERERFAADTDRLDLALRLGRHSALLPELTDRATAHPLNEHVAAQLMLALYRAGRQAEALDEYRQLRARLADELGAEPGQELRRLHQQVLSADADLTAPAADRSPVVPRQLPAAPAPFTGRVPELAELDRALLAAPRGQASGTVAVGGVGGIGKTWLALSWAHRNLHRFPDGQLFVDLHGFSPTGEPIDPADALRGFLTALGVAPDRAQADPGALYRGLMAGRRALVVLDNAATADQVVPLLPGSPTCTVLVTSRTSLPSVIDRHGAHHLPLGVLTSVESRALLTSRLGEHRADAEPGAVDELVGLCGRHPLALVITARHAATRPRLPLAELAAELREPGLEVLDHETDVTASLPAVLSWSLHRLTAQQRAVFVLLGIAPGPDIDLPAAASLTGLTTTEARRALRVLEDHSLLDRHPHGRHAMHDLVRAYATTTAADHLPEPEREAALERLADFYLHTAHTAERSLNPHRPPIHLDPPAPGTHSHPLPDRAAALAWMDAHHPHLLAVQHDAATRRRHRTAWRIAWTLATFHRLRGHIHDDLAVWQAAADAAGHLPEPGARILAHRLLGHALAELGRHDDAIANLHQALALARRHHDLTQQAHTEHALTWAWEQRGDDHKALEHARHALDLFRALDQPVWEATALNMVGWYAARVGEYDHAREHCQAALDLYRRHDDPDGEADTLDSFGWIEHHTGHHHRAIDHYRQALALYRTVGNATEAADTLDNLGHPHTALGDHAPARAAWQEALDLYRRQGRHTDAERVRRQLAELDVAPAGRSGASADPPGGCAPGAG
ncbi:tetratricopeptide repeat protein [Saccharothrix sp. 6-C]|uniref:AfsR/SARP family transcriptional regulator n=1 Tax=Saccharothrix sp. 6-C TaxID=2781735 RepID=UPI001916DAF3|nr:BTAD domain-containing putative transcriptional regulator [Saccharothrix sp. 6-C]QQQ78705.1 tetratricopeptide repeat protein [Saccharothrix sp. 6-C]